jgi:hypothetical protein
MGLDIAVSEFDELEAASFLHRKESSGKSTLNNFAAKAKCYWKPVSLVSLLVVGTIVYLSKAENLTTALAEVEEIQKTSHLELKTKVHHEISKQSVAKKEEKAVEVKEEKNAPIKEVEEAPPSKEVSSEKKVVAETKEEATYEFNSSLQKLRAARSKILEEFKSSLYGEYTDAIFNDSSLLNSTIYSKTPLSIDRLQRRLKIKLLQSQLGDKTPSSFTWVTAGHSAAAGHGNLFSQSYSAVLEQTLKEVFKLLNIDFKAKNYAMGGLPSGPELALCMEALFGTDIDFLSWDFGMTDGRDDFLYELWIQRAGVHPNRPILMDFKCHDRINLPMEKAGMSIFSFNKDNMWKPIPDSINNPNLEKLSPVIKYFKCGSTIENGDPCGDHKWDTKKSCDTAMYQTSWHNGWRDHGTIGRLFAFFIMKNLEEAITELTERFPANQSTRSLRMLQDQHERYLSDLQKLEEDDKNTFLSSPESSSFGRDNEFGLDNFKLFQRSKVVCHNSQLPSQARYDGLLSDGKDKKGKYHFAGYHKDYDIGLEVGELMEKEFKTEIRPLLFAREPHLRQACETPLNHDYKDMFYVHNQFGWTGDTIPNNAENEAFSVGDDWKDRKGMIIACTRICDWGNCKPNYVGISEVKPRIEYNRSMNEKNETVMTNITYPTNLTIHVNDEPVVEAKHFFKNCYLLSNKDGYKFPSNKNPKLKGQYDIKFKVLLSNGFVELTSIIIS